MKDSKQQDSSAQDPLENLVYQTKASRGITFEGYEWAILPLQDWADESGLSLSTVKRRFSKPPYDTLRKKVEGVQATLVRIGEPDPNQPSRLAATMAKMYCKSIVLNEKINAKQKAFAAEKGETRKPKKTVTPAEYGCLHGLVQDWRPYWQLAIFKHTISSEGWSTFMVEAKSKMVDIV